ncbi:hypothetical protein E4M02_03445 [Brevundimonas sp. S30B]|uniref:COG3650 family protein n=1 Tax=unclassified Brevundimonas TaxID=2622653 RepID=UPI0010729BAD|nr:MULTISPECIES: hypothetical protein [unclassified Brevundimonas]QBX37064.1 hypothetical protein E4M01_04370 [Brevundimonas sp. MF30-B]TFW04140.1 hypothetical protein E4M02_03445 [Brevundimonas sp. S30B]
MRLVALISLLALAACSDPAPAPETTSETPAIRPAMLGGVNLNEPVRALGTEPFWSVEIGPDQLAYDRAGEITAQRAAHDGPQVQGTMATWQATDGSMTVTLMATECSDGMSDRTYPLTARIEVGQETLNGCAAATAAVLRAAESGAVG